MGSATHYGNRRTAMARSRPQRTVAGMLIGAPRQPIAANGQEHTSTRGPLIVTIAPLGALAPSLQPLRGYFALPEGGGQLLTNLFCSRLHRSCYKLGVRDIPWIAPAPTLKACLKSPGLQSSPAKDRFRVRHRPFSSSRGKGSNCPIAAASNLHRYRLGWVGSGHPGGAKSMIFGAPVGTELRPV